MKNNPRTKDASHLYDFPVHGGWWDDKKSTSINGWWFWEYLNNFNNEFDEVEE
ncbi:MAG: hypothetical protein ABT940_07070 [Alphaproteobacteria bacterium]